MTTSGNGSETSARQWAMIAHLSALSGYIIPFGTILGPLIVWQMKKKEFEFVDDQGKEALNFQITLGIYGIISLILALVGIGFLLLAALGILGLVGIIWGAIKANEGERFRFPLILRLIK
ncbi:MAG: DUF4870 domain-containing protein [Candidatus Eisenbacteria bacterium]|uniref:DUF4870 domain-containing protein n=1 Tax=Eiseniibacteriota bacterium TaxID=2212470 RepID=A0A7Y2E9C2_UNCEI|nr:DUF4870 domain-containing protein [Candidatus Eisenbacteria bacterium]